MKVHDLTMKRDVPIQLAFYCDDLTMKADDPTMKTDVVINFTFM